MQYYEYDHCFFYSFATSWDFTYISLTYIGFDLSGSTRCSQFEIEFGKNSKTYACALKKNLSQRYSLGKILVYDSVHMRENTDTILSIYGKIRLEKARISAFYAVIKKK